MRRLDLAACRFHAPCAVVQTARRRAGRVLAVGVVHAAVAGAHEQARLREPGDRAAEVGAVDREHQELILAFVILAFVAGVDAGERGDAVPRLAQRVVEVDPPRLVEWKLGDRSQVDPIDRALSQSEKVSDERDAQDGGRDRAADGRHQRRNVRRGLADGAIGGFTRSWRIHGYVSIVTNLPESLLGTCQRQLFVGSPIGEQRDQVVDFGRGQRLEVGRAAVAARRKLACQDRGGR